MTNQVSRPFPPDEPKRPVVIPPCNPVRDAARAFRQRLATEYKAELDDLRSYAEREWRRYRAGHPFADNHTEYVDAIVESLAPEPPPRLTDHEAFRLSIPFDDRLRLLGEHCVFDEFAKVFTVRAGGQIALKALREVLSRYAPGLTDAALFTILDDARLTVRNGQVLFITGLVEQERRADLPTLPIGLERQYRDQLITEDTERFDPRDF